RVAVFSRVLGERLAGLVPTRPACLGLRMTTGVDGWRLGGFTITSRSAAAQGWTFVCVSACVERRAIVDAGAAIDRRTRIDDRVAVATPGVRRVPRVRFRADVLARQTVTFVFAAKPRAAG